MPNGHYRVIGVLNFLSLTPITRMHRLTSLIRSIGDAGLRLFHYLGGIALLMVDTLRSLFVSRIRWRLVKQQIAEVGYRSQSVVVITGGFIGAVFAAQTFFQFKVLGIESGVGSVVAVAMCRELGPVLTGVMLAGRVGAAMSAEIGTMKVTEQIDALRALAVYPVDYLVVPRVVAMLIAVPLLTAECIAFGIGAGYLMGVHVLGISEPYFIDNLLKYMMVKDVFMGISKGWCFGLFIVFISCYQGLNTRNGAVGVGRSTTQAVVSCSLAILISNLFLTMFLNIFFPGGQS